MQFGLIDERHNKIQAVLRRFATIEEAVIFGSRAMNTHKPASDIDLALKGKNVSFNDILKLRNALDELPYGYSYDILNYNTISNPELLEHVDNFGVVFYQA